MLFAVEGGGFFSSSASGYSKGLTLLLLGQKNKEKPMRVIPWTQYQLVDQETNPDLQLASGKNSPVRRCVCFVCFSRGSAAGLESPSTLKVEPAQNQEVLPENSDFAERKDQTHLVDDVNDDDSNRTVTSIKSSLKKPANSAPVATNGSSSEENSNEHETLCEEGNEITCQIERRKVQWTDTVGGELFEIREFEMSEDDSDDEFDHSNKKTCSCRIM